MQWHQGFHRSISSIIGGIFIIIIMIVFMGLVITTMDKIYSYGENIANRLRSLIDIYDAKHCINSYWIYEEPNIHIHVENSCGKTVLLIGIAIIFRDGSYIIASRINKTFSSIGFPYPLPPGGNITISFRVRDKPIAISISITTRL